MISKEKYSFLSNSFACEGEVFCSLERKKLYIINKKDSHYSNTVLDNKNQEKNTIVLFEKHFSGILRGEPDLPGCDFISFDGEPSKVISALDMGQTVYVLTRDAVSVRNLLIREIPVVEDKLNHVRRWTLIDKYLLIGLSVKDS